MRKTIIAVVVGLVLGVLATSAPAKQAVNRLLGVWSSYDVVESFWMSVGVDNLGHHLKAREVEELRHHVNVPSHYGELCSVSQGGSSTVFWFKDCDGLLRNVVVEDSNSRLYRIQTFETSRFEAKIVLD